MAWPIDLDVALKEWASVTRALESGRQIVLLRKGGIHPADRHFEIEHRQFLHFPTYLHQSLDKLKEADREGFEHATAEPAQVRITSAGVVSDIVQIASRDQIDAIDAEHVWTPPVIDMRFRYRPKSPLYLLLVRVYRLPEPITVENTPAYAGCKSWVPLGRAYSISDSAPVLNDAQYDSRRQVILNKLKESDHAIPSLG